MRFELLDIGGYFIGVAGLITKRELQPLEGSGQLIQSIRFLRTEGPVKIATAEMLSCWCESIESPCLPCVEVLYHFLHQFFLVI